MAESLSRSHTPWRVRVTRAMPWFVLFGPDGSGKSTVAQHVAEHFVAACGRSARVFHRRPSLLLKVKAGPGNGQGPRTLPSHGLAKSVAKLAVLALDWHVGFWIRVAPELVRGNLVLFDRHNLVDILVDPTRYRYGGPRWLAWRLHRLLPRPTLFILLDSAPETLLARNQEFALEHIVQQCRAYRELASQLPGGRVVDGSRELTEVVRDVWDVIGAEVPTQ